MQYHDEENYHVYNRGAHKQPIFYSDENYRYCIQLLEKYLRVYNVSLLCYCLMPNHYHFLLRQERGGSISRFLQTTFNAYTQAINKGLGHSGTMFQGRTKGIRVHTDRYLVHLVRYIRLNPVTARMVKLPEEWEFSDYREWIYARSDSKFINEIRKMYFQSVDEYKSFIQEYVQEREQEILRDYLFDEE